MGGIRGRGCAPTSESFHLGIARASYAQGTLTLEEFERSAEHVLRGGHLDRFGRIPEPPAFEAPLMDTVYG